jgi:hypothetical protein
VPAWFFYEDIMAISLAPFSYFLFPEVNQDKTLQAGIALWPEANQYSERGRATPHLVKLNLHNIDL